MTDEESSGRSDDPATDRDGMATDGPQRQREVETGTDSEPETGRETTDEPETESEDTDEWKFSLDDLADEAENEDDGDGEDTATDGEDSFTPEPNATPITAGVPSAENAVFVVLGALAMLFVIFRLTSVAFLG